MSIRRRLALWLCPELLQIPISTAPPDEQVNAISALLSLINAYQQQTGFSDWEVASRAGANNRAIFILRDGRPIAEKTAARLFEYLQEAWPSSLEWPLTEAETARFATIYVIPAMEMVGGKHQVHALIEASGRTRTIDAVQTWVRREGMPEYARYLVRHFGEKHGISFTNDDFLPTRMTPAEITKLRLVAPDIPRPIPSTEVEQ